MYWEIFPMGMNKLEGPWRNNVTQMYSTLSFLPISFIKVEHFDSFEHLNTDDI